MTQIVLTPDQARLLRAGRTPVVLLAPDGRELAYVTTGFSPSEIAEAELQLDSDGPWATTAEVFDRLQRRDVAP